MKTHVPKRITIHCSATPNGKSVSIEAMTADHVAKGYGGLGYHGVIQPNGDWVQGRGFNEVGAHVAGANTGNIGICLVGTDKFTKAQLVTLRYKLDSLLLTFSIPRWEIHGHKEFPTAIEQGKCCPGIWTSHLVCWYSLNEEKAVEKYVLQ